MEKVVKKSVKSRIVSAAWQLFYEKGYNGTTVDDIIELSETSKGSFYYYFSTKDELLNTLSLILDEFYEELEQKLKEWERLRNTEDFFYRDIDDIVFEL